MSTSTLDYISQLCRDLGVPDPVEEYFAPVVGRWTDMHDEADRWRAAGKAAGEVADALTTPLRRPDAAWEGDTADSFIAYMQSVGLAGHDMSDAMEAMAAVLDRTADGIREIVTQLAGVLDDTAHTSAQAMASPLGGEERTRQHLNDVRGPTREFFEAVKEVLEAFVQLCDGIDGTKAFEPVKMAHTLPAQAWDPHLDVPQTPEPKKPEETAVHTSGSGAGGGARAGGGSHSGGGSHGGGSASGPGDTAKSAPLPPGASTAVGEMPPALPSEAASAPSAGAAAAAAGGGGMGAGGMMGGMMGGMGAAGGGGQEHSNKSRTVTDPEDVFGAPGDYYPSVIGEDE
jgi:uncharacterized protein YukE